MICQPGLTSLQTDPNLYIIIRAMYIFFVILKKVFIKSMNTSSIEYMSLSLLSIVRIEQAMFYKEQRENGSKKCVSLFFQMKYLLYCMGVGIA